MIQLALVVAGATLGIGLVGALLLGLLPTVRLQLAGLALLAVVLPLGAVLLSGWVMFHMGDDVKILAVASASASAAVLVGLFLAHGIVQRLDHLRSSSAALAAGDLSARAERAAQLSSPSSPRSTRWHRISRCSSTPGASWSPGRAMTCARRSRVLQAMIEAMEDRLVPPSASTP